MARREVLTIGYMRSGGRYGARTRSLRAIGQTETNYVPPSLEELDATPPGAALTAATRAMFQHFASSGVPSEHTDDPFVRSMQQAYVTDPLSRTTGSPVPLAVDGGYGPNTQATADVLSDYTGGGPAPAVNRGTTPVAPAPSPAAPTRPTVTPSTPTKPAEEGSSPWPWVLGIGGAVLVLLIIARKRKRKGGSHTPSPAVLIKANPFKRAHPRHAGMR